MDSIGGYFELADYEDGVFPHNNGILLNTGRNALEYILRSLGDINNIYLPYFTCDVVLEPINKLNIPWTYYSINSRFEIVEDINPQKGEFIIVNNYFGIKDSYILSLSQKYGEHLIIDCAQALFAKPIHGTNAFYSTRKFVGVADGGVAYLDRVNGEGLLIKDFDNSSDHDSHLLIRKELGAEAGFSDYQKNENKLRNQPISFMSKKTKWILNHIDYNKVISRRKANFKFLHSALANNNKLELPDLDNFACPMVYPFVPNFNRSIRGALINNKVYVAKYWPSVYRHKSFELEYYLAERLIPIPCDQRYSEEQMERIIDLINMLESTI